MLEFFEKDFLQLQSLASDAISKLLPDDPSDSIGPPTSSLTLSRY